jgi:hypothetical protein
MGASPPGTLLPTIVTEPAVVCVRLADVRAHGGRIVLMLPRTSACASRCSSRPIRVEGPWGPSSARRSRATAVRGGSGSGAWVRTASVTDRPSTVRRCRSLAAEAWNAGVAGLRVQGLASTPFEDPESRASSLESAGGDPRRLADAIEQPRPDASAYLGARRRRTVAVTTP